jgi:hypothetical protein
VFEEHRREKFSRQGAQFAIRMFISSELGALTPFGFAQDMSAARLPLIRRTGYIA